MFNLDPAKLLVIAIVGIILLGPDKLPHVAKQAGAAWRTLNEFRHRMESEVRNTIPDLPPTSEIARLARSPSALLNHLSTMSTEEDGDEVPDGAYKPPDDVAATDGSGTPGGAAGPKEGDAASTPPRRRRRRPRPQPRATGGHRALTGRPARQPRRPPGTRRRRFRPPRPSRRFPPRSPR